MSALTRLAVRRRMAGVPTLLRWSRRSAADVLRELLHTSTRCAATGAVGGPMVWGISPRLRNRARRADARNASRRARVGRPVGGSGAMPEAVLRQLPGGRRRVGLATAVTAIDCEGERVRGVTLADGTAVRAPVVVSACDPHRTFLQWLRGAPPSANSTIERWRAIEQADGYESKIDAVLTGPPVLTALGHADRHRPPSWRHR